MLPELQQPEENQTVIDLERDIMETEVMAPVACSYECGFIISHGHKFCEFCGAKVVLPKQHQREDP